MDGLLQKFAQLLAGLAGILTKLYNVLCGGWLTGQGESRERSATIQDSNGTRRRRVSDSAKPYSVMPPNLFNFLAYGKELSGNGPCLGFRTSKNEEYQWLSYQTITDRAVNFGAGLMTLGGKSNCEFLIGIFAKSCVDWTVAEFGCFAYGMATAPLYDALGSEACQDSVRQFGIDIMICGSDAQVRALLDGDKFPANLRTIITMEQLSGDRIAQVESLGVKILTMVQVEEIGSLNPLPLRLAETDTLATLIFTSGTTGPPKGAMLTHANFMQALQSFIRSTHPIRLNSEDRALALFPLAHIFERALEKIIHLHGGRVAYLTSDITGMLKDAQDVRPTYFVFVPRLMNRLHDQIKAAFNKTLLGKVVGRIAVAAKIRDIKKGNFRTDTIWDILVFRKCQKLLGGCIRTGLVGSAAVEGYVLTFIRAVFGCYIFEMYGQTEGGGPITSTQYGDCTTDHVGIPCVDVEVKLVDVPEMGYFAENQCGEICSRSKFTMRGYYRMPEKTAETLDEDGWLHTGDIGMWTEDGKLRVFDRKKHIFKLSQGEYLAPERLENIFGRSNLVTTIFVDGDSKYPYPVALVYPNYVALEVSPEQVKSDGEKSDIYARIIADLTRLGKECKLKSYEIPQKIAILEEPFSIANNCITQSQKTKREVVRTLHRERLRKLYV